MSLTDIYGDDVKPIAWRYVFRGAETNADAKD